MTTARAIPDLRRLFGRGFVYSATDATTALVALVVVPIYTRHLSPADYGVYGTLAAARQFLAPVIGLGLVSALRSMYHTGDEQERPRVLPTVLNAALIWSFAISLLVSLVTAAYFATSGAHLPYMTHFLLTVWTVFALGFYFVPLTIFVLDHRPGRYAAYNIVTSVGVLLANIFFVVVLDLGLVGALVANLVAGLFGMAMVAVAVRRRYEPIIDRAQLRVALRIALPTLPHVLASSAWRFSDRLFLTALGTLSEAGIYTLAAMIATVIPLGLGGLSTAFNAEFYRRTATDDPTFPDYWSRLVTVYWVVTASAWLAFALLADQLVDLIGTSAYRDAADVLPLLAVGHSVMALGWVFAPGVERARRTSAYAKATLPSLVLNALLNVLLIPVWGATGAALAFTVTSMAQVALFGRYSLRAYAFPLDQRGMGATALLAGALFAAGRIADSGLDGAVSLALDVLLLAAFPFLLVVTRVVAVRDIRALLVRRAAAAAPDDAE